MNLGFCHFFRTSNIHFSFEDVSALALLLLPLRFLQGIWTEMNIFSCFLIKSKCQVNLRATRSWGAWFAGCPVSETSVGMMLMLWNQSPLYKMSPWTCPFIIAPLGQYYFPIVTRIIIAKYARSCLDERYKGKKKFVKNQTQIIMCKLRQIRVNDTRREHMGGNNTMLTLWFGISPFVCWIWNLLCVVWGPGLLGSFLVMMEFTDVLPLSPPMHSWGSPMLLQST